MGLKEKYGLGRKGIPWSHISWNWFTGCEGPEKDGVHCPGCYAKFIAENRMRGRCGYPEDEPFRPTLHPDKLYVRYGWRTHPSIRTVPTIYFNVSMGDWLLAEEEEAKHACRIMEENPQHIFITLTKLYNDLWRIPGFFDDGQIPENVWIGASICNNEQVWGLNKLCEVDCAVRFWSYEPALKDLSFINLAGIDWIVIGARTKQGSVPAFRPEEEWVRKLVNKARNREISVFLKPNLKYVGEWYPEPIEEMPFHLMSEKSIWHETLESHRRLPDV
jgi:protein gp37